jgi:sugar phosphate isomerase/epimerase
VLSDSDVKARLDVSRSFMRSTRSSLIGLEVLEREGSLSKSKLTAQASKIDEIRKELSNMGGSLVLSVHAPYVPIGKIDLASTSTKIRKSTVAAVDNCVELAEDIGARVVNTHLGGIIRTTSKKSFCDPAVKNAMLKRVKDALIDLVGRVEGRNILLAIENVPYPLEEISYGYSPVIGIFPGDFLKILKEVGSRDLGITVDFCHLWITYKTLKVFLKAKDGDHSEEVVSPSHYRGLTSYEMDSIKSFVKDSFGGFVIPLCERIVHVHAADSKDVYVPGRSNVTEGNCLGEGDMDLAGFVQSLRKIESCSSTSVPMMIVVEPREVSFDNPLNSLRSLLKLNELIGKL